MDLVNGYRKRRHKLQVGKETPEWEMKSNHGLLQQLHNDYTNITLQKEACLRYEDGGILTGKHEEQAKLDGGARPINERFGRAWTPAWN